MIRQIRRTAREVLTELMQGTAMDSPFEDQLVHHLVEEAHRILGPKSRQRPQDRGCVIRLRLLQELLRRARDPDAEVITRYIEGVPISVGIKMQRTPAAFMRRTRWSIAEQRLRGAHEAEQ